MSTQVKVINRPLPKAKAIIVGYKKGVHKVKIDKIVLHTAFTLSDEVYLIENVQITPQDKLIYICGHGNADKQTIGGRYMDEIADFLIMQGWFGQQIYLTSCESNMPAKKGEYKGQIICNKLDNILEKEMISIVNMNRINTNYKKLIIGWIRSTRYVYSEAISSTVTLKSDSGEPRIFTVQFGGIDEFIYDIRANFIDNKITKLDSIEINKANFTYLKEQNKLYYKEMQKHKKDLLMKYGYKKKSIIYRLKELKDKFEEESKGKM